MKRLYIVRHAKSSWKFPDLSDIERPLNSRGRRDAPIMAAYFAGLVQCPEVFIASPSRRTYDTAKEFVRAFEKEPTEIELTEHLYHASSQGLKSIIPNISDECSSAVLFGHNPGVTDFVNEVCQQEIYNIPTSGLVGISLDIESWKDIRSTTGKLDFYHFPKGL